MQRLFSTFPNGWPGFGLLLLRLSIGIALISMAAVNLPGKISQPVDAAPELIRGASGIFLLAGLWTPVFGVLAALSQIWIAFASYSQQGDQIWPIFLAILAASIAMLGPGAWSIDARLFGRKRVVTDRPSKVVAKHPPK